MSDNMTNEVVLIGTGPMAVDYAKVLKGLKVNLTVVGRGTESADRFTRESGLNALTGGLENYLIENQLPEQCHVIVATGTEMLMPILLLLSKQKSIKSILLEKPAALSIEQLLDNEIKLQPITEKTFVAYNRRFYSSVLETQRLIEEDGGLQSLHFEFTEWAHKIGPSKKASGVKENWFFANSTHVVDLAFYLAGKPLDWKAFSQEGAIDWHRKSRFSGAGITHKNVLFSYMSNWESAGRWSLEMLTASRRIYLKPMEQVQIQLKGTIAVVPHVFDQSIDEDYKPGLFKQTEAFIQGTHRAKLLSLATQFDNARDIYRIMLA